MGLFSRKPPPPLPGPDAPVDEHLDVVLAGRPGAVYALVRALAARPLWQACRDLPPDAVDPATGLVLREFDLQVARTTMPDGRLGANVSTTPELVLARTPDGIPFAKPGAEVLAEVVADPELHGLVLNPAGRWQALAKDWIADGLAGREV